MKPASYPTTVPEETLHCFEKRAHRPRNREVDKLLQAPSPLLSFTIKRLIRTEEEKYSQVLFGVLGDADTELCLKLFDERYFPVPLLKDSWYGNASRLRPETRLEDFNIAEDVIRRELAAYEGCKLKEMQGNMILHCYGAHLVGCLYIYTHLRSCISPTNTQFKALPGDWKAYGLLLEVIHGPFLFDNSPQPCKRNQNAQIALVREPLCLDACLQLGDQVKQLRHCTRIFKLCGVEQTDWRSEQVICMPRGDSMDENTETFNYEIVLIVFAFALQRLEGEGYGLPPTIDVKHPWGILSNELAIPTELLYEH